jgi:ribosomal peptide maturation radical SAM protein 1
MMSHHKKSFDRIVLISTPWSLYSRPSVQIGALKAYLDSEFPELGIEAHHIYLKIAEAVGYRLYQAISERLWLAEAVYGALLFPERAGRIEKMFYKEARGVPELRKVDFQGIVRRVKEISDRYIDGTDWERFDLAGFSICLCQLTSALYFIQQIKGRCPKVPIVIGGSAISGPWARQYAAMFPEIDYVVNGEGEKPLSGLIKDTSAEKEMSGIESSRTKNADAGATASGLCQISDIDTLPMPDYGDYFRLLETFSPEKRFFPTLPVEMSRGCRWRRRIGDAGSSGCAFCNLNLQWDGYRAKTPSRIVKEVDRLTSTFQTLSVAFMDNLLPGKSSEEIFVEISKLKKDLGLFGEIRATTKRQTLEKMRSAGIREVQIGIEALSTRLLKKINKGTTAIENLEIMKNCEALGIGHNSNLIVQFPGSDDQDVAETLRTLDFALPFRPLRSVRFWLGLGSGVWDNPENFGIRSTFNHPYYAAIFPSHICRSVRFMIQGYCGDLGKQRKRWKPVKKKVETWKKTYDALHCGSSNEPILSFRDGREFMIIRQRRWDEDPMTHRLVGASREIYLFCQTHRYLNQISENFSGFSEEKLLPFLRMMVDKRLMFEEKGKYLSLSVPAISPFF